MDLWTFANHNMARYPTFDEYARNGKHDQGIARCDELLTRTPKDVQLLTVKLQLICHFHPSSDEGPKVLEQLVSITPPLQDLQEIVPIEVAVVDSFKNTHPLPLTAGPAVAKLWENAFKANANVNYRLDLLSVRFQRAIYDNRIQDAQQALIHLKSVQPKNRALYLAHTAYTQLLSEKPDDLQSKLALGLARKAVSENFDDDKTLDCRVAGQIFAIQGSEKDLESIKDRQPFRESKQVYEALQLHKQGDAGDASGSASAGAESATLSPRKWLEAEVAKKKNELKTLMDDEASEDAIAKFVADATLLFHKAITSLDLGLRNRVAAEPCYLAISGLVKLFSTTNVETHLLQAAFLAERLLAFNEHVHEARLVLVYLYMRLGLGRDAMRLFDSLNIKEVQFDTVGHTLFTRLSSTSPFRANIGPKTVYDPHERTYKALQIYPRHENKVFETEAAVLEHSQTGMIFDLNQLRSELRQSWMRRVIILEHRRTARLSGKGFGKHTSDIGPRVVANWTVTKDNRDFNAAFDYGYNVERALHSRNGTIPGTTWLIYNLATDTAWSLANKQVPLITDTPQLLETLTAALQAEEPPSELTAPERRAAALITTLLPPLHALQTGTPPSPSSLDAIASALTALSIPDLLKTPAATLTEHLHDHHIFTDALLIVVRTCKSLKESAKDSPAAHPIPADAVARVQHAALQAIRDLQAHATEQSAALRVRNVADRLVGGALGAELAGFGDPAVQDFAAVAVAAAKEGWDGVGKITMPS
jgi:N-terminal acetyltransferase B complex non-catalytic subunit